jgi:hypothetical protein
MILTNAISPSDLSDSLKEFWKLSGEKVLAIEKNFDPKNGAPVFTEKGRYVTRGWTEWTQGFQYGSAILQFDATGDEQFLEIGRKNTVEKMAPHLTHIGVHDHGFNNVSTYGNLLRLIKEKKISVSDWEEDFYKLALKISGAVQATRWSKTQEGGYIYSFNGPHSLFVDTIRSCRALVVSHGLGHVLQGENDRRISLIQRAVQHIRSTMRYSIYMGNGRDSYDIPGRTAHEIIFNTNDGNYRCPNSQQGYTGFSTWTRGLAWAICGLGETLEILDELEEKDYEPIITKEVFKKEMKEAALATANFYLKNTPTDGIPYWDTGAPNLYKMGDYLNRPAEPYNSYEPVDSSAACIAAQGLIRIGNWLKINGEAEWDTYVQAGLQVAKALFQRPYLSYDSNHEGLILHSIYHEPNGWDYKPDPKLAAHGESSMWGDYHARELALLIQRMANGENYYSFYNCVKS